MIGMCTEHQSRSNCRSSSFWEGALPALMTSGSSQAERGEEDFRQGGERFGRAWHGRGTPHRSVLEAASATTLQSAGTSPGWPARPSYALQEGNVS